MSNAVTLLSEVEAAISKTLTSQSYSVPGGRQQQMADLKALKDFRRELIDEVANATGNSGAMSSLLQLEDVH